LHLDVLGSASGGHGQAEVRNDTTHPGRDPVGPLTSRVWEIADLIRLLDAADKKAA
jgi:hypothetical protein